MMNLISQEAKKRVASQYFLRLGTVSLLVIAAFLFLGSVLLIPSYFIVSEKESSERVRAEELMKSEAFQENKELEILVNLTKEQLLITDSMSSFMISEKLLKPILDHVYTNATKVQLGLIKYHTEESEAVINIRGTALSRDSLLSFIEALKKDILFSRVEVPVSSFVQNTNIKFSATLYVTLENI